MMRTLTEHALNRSAPLTRAELKAIALAFQGARGRCEVVVYIGELTLLEAQKLRPPLEAVKKHIGELEMLEKWQEDGLGVDLVLFAEDLSLAIEACQMRLEATLEQYIRWFATSELNSTPRALCFYTRFSRLNRSLVSLKNAIRELHDDMPNPATPASVPAPVTVNETAFDAQLDERPVFDPIEPQATTIEDVVALKQLPSTTTEHLEQSTAEAAFTRLECTVSEKLEVKLKESSYYLPARDANGWVVIPSELFSEDALARIEEAKALYADAEGLRKDGCVPEAVNAAQEAIATIKVVYDGSAPTDRATLADLLFSLSQACTLALEDARQDAAALSTSEEALCVCREAVVYRPNDLSLRVYLACTMVNVLAGTAIDQLLNRATLAMEAVDVHRHLPRLLQPLGGFGGTWVLTQEEYSVFLLRALCLLAIALSHSDPEAARAYLEEADAEISSSRIDRDPSTFTMQASAYEKVGEAYKEAGDQVTTLKMGRKGLQACRDYREAAQGRALVVQQSLHTLCKELMPGEEKRLVKLVNIRKMQAAARKKVGRKDAEEDKALMAVAVAELADLRKFKTELENGTL